MTEILRTLSDSIIISDAINRKFQRNLSDTISLSDSVLRSLLRTLSDTVSLSDSLSRILDWVRTLDDTVSLSDSIKITNTMKVFELNPSSGGVESLSASRKSGWVPVSDLSRKNFVRRINARYQSVDIINIKLFTDGDDVTEVWSGSFPANSSNGKKYASRRVGIRAKHLMVSFELDTSVSYGQEINRIEVEVDD